MKWRGPGEPCGDQGYPLMLKTWQGSTGRGQWYCCILNSYLSFLECGKSNSPLQILNFTSSHQEFSSLPPPAGWSFSVFQGTYLTPRPCFHPTGCSSGKMNSIVNNWGRRPNRFVCAVLGGVGEASSVCWFIPGKCEKFCKCACLGTTWVPGLYMVLLWYSVKYILKIYSIGL